MALASPGESAMEIIHEGWDHLRSRRPLAAWASWQRALRLDAGSEPATRRWSVWRNPATSRRPPVPSTGSGRRPTRLDAQPGMSGWVR